MENQMTLTPLPLIRGVVFSLVALFVLDLVGGPFANPRPENMFFLGREVRADQYGIRTTLLVDEFPIKFEIVLEGRIALETAGVKDQVCGVSTLTPLDLATSKLLANADCWSDDGVFSRDVIDLAMMSPDLPLLRKALHKAQGAYGEVVARDLGRAIARLQNRVDWLERCMKVMAISQPKALLWSKIRLLRRVLP